MSNQIPRILAALALLALLSTLNPQFSTAFAQGTAFTYQGRLNQGSVAANGVFDLQTEIFDAVSGGTLIAGPLTNLNVGVTNGLFTVPLDFGPGVFTGNKYWLDVAVRTNGAATFTELAPRQALTPSPYAIFAESASNLVGVLPASDLSGTYTGSVNFNNPNNSFTGNGSGITNVNASLLGGLAKSNFWQTAGNAGTSPTLGNFVGTTDNQPLELHVNGLRALRLEPGPSNTNGAPNVIGGSSVNFVVSGFKGAVIAGGGAVNFDGSGETNSVNGDFGAVGGGYGNTAGGFGTVAGGVQNTASGSVAAVLGGAFNNAGASYSLVGGGFQNTASGAGAVVVGGGFDGTAYQINQNAGNASFIGGGLNNNINLGANYAVITGGGGHAINSNANYAIIAGGQNNLVDIGSTASAILGGAQNSIFQNTDHSAIGGGYFNIIIPFFGSYDTIGGGENNSISGAFISNSVVAGGGANKAAASAATVSGGQNNVATNIYSTVGGGYTNLASGDASVVSGGENNTASGDHGAVGGGLQNLAGGAQTTVAGGNLNSADGDRSTVGGGQNNTAFGAADTLAGGVNNSSGGGNVSTISGGEENNSSGSDAVIGGGMGNQVSAFYATIGGGVNNTATNNSSVVSGGTNNISGGTASTVAGGANNTATGDYSLAAGNNAAATNQYSFVWSDGSTNTFSTRTNQFVARASGGFVLFSSKASTGVSLAAGSGSWSSLSDRNAKQDFSPVNPQAVLARVAALPLTTWSYKTEVGVRHVGPMAQDFYTAFDVGEDDHHIAEVDESGVALVAIQGLNQELKQQLAQKESEISKLQQQNQSLEQRLNQLAQTVQALSEERR